MNLLGPLRVSMQKIMILSLTVRSEKRRITFDMSCNNVLLKKGASPTL